jgi:hypothetical protein
MFRIAAALTNIARSTGESSQTMPISHLAGGDVDFFRCRVAARSELRSYLTVIVCVSLYSWLPCLPVLPSTLMYRFEVRFPQMLLQLEGLTVHEVVASQRLPLLTAVAKVVVVPMETLKEV